MEYFIERVDDEDENVLEHHGILGMKWGVRRYQNADGSLTDKGQAHRTLREKIHDYKVTKKRVANLKKARLARQQKKEEEEKQAKEAEKRKELIKKGQINYKDMTDDELYERINRLSNEKRLKALEDELIALNTPPKKKSKMKELGGKFLNDAVVPALSNAGKTFIEKKAKDLLGLNVKEAKSAYQQLKEEAEMSKWRKQLLDDKHDSIIIKEKTKLMKKGLDNGESIFALLAQEKANGNNKNKDKNKNNDNNSKIKDDDSIKTNGVTDERRKELKQEYKQNEKLNEEARSNAAKRGQDYEDQLSKNEEDYLNSILNNTTKRGKAYEDQLTKNEEEYLAQLLAKINNS